jgi:hypothetical protein
LRGLFTAIPIFGRTLRHPDNATHINCLCRFVASL